MILGTPDATDRPAGAPAGGPTLDELFRRAVAARPHALALLDPPDRQAFTDGAPRRLTWAEADRVVSAVANLFKSLGLPPGAIVALQLPNVVESVLAFMGVLRAGLIAAPLPLLWRQAEACAALGRVSARALVSCRRVGDVDHAELAMHVAAETFAIRFVCAFGDPLPDGIIPLDEVLDGALAAPAPTTDPLDDPAGRPAVVTFDVAADGFVPVARSHRELIAAGEAVAAATELAPGATLVGALLTASFAGIGSTIVPWLISGATLSLHQPFDAGVLATQRGDAVVLPGPLLSRLAETGLAGPGGARTVLAVWRAPERLRSAPSWPDALSRVVDVPVFGEIGLLALPRGDDGAPAELPAVPTGGLELTRSASGTLALRGAMVPAHPCPPGSPRGPQFNLAIGRDGFADTLFPCHADRATGRLMIDGPPAGIVSVGGYRFAVRDLHDLVGPLDPDGSVAALPDTLAGHRLAGIGGDRGAIADKLAEQGANPLVVGAFRDQGPGRASAG